MDLIGVDVSDITTEFASSLFETLPFTKLVGSLSTAFTSDMVGCDVSSLSFGVNIPGTSSFITMGALISSVLLSRFFFLPPSFFMDANAFLSVDLGEGWTLAGVGLEAVLWVPEKVEERVGFVWGGLGLSDLTGVTGCDTGDFGGGGLEATKKKEKVRACYNSRLLVPSLLSQDGAIRSIAVHIHIQSYCKPELHIFLIRLKAPTFCNGNIGNDCCLAYPDLLLSSICL